MGAIHTNRIAGYIGAPQMTYRQRSPVLSEKIEYLFIIYLFTTFIYLVLFEQTNLEICAFEIMSDVSMTERHSDFAVFSGCYSINVTNRSVLFGLVNLLTPWSSWVLVNTWLLGAHSVYVSSLKNMHNKSCNKCWNVSYLDSLDLFHSIVVDLIRSESKNKQLTWAVDHKILGM